MNRQETLTPYEVTPARVASARAARGWFCHHAVQENGIPVTCSIGLTDLGSPCDFVLLGVEELLSRMIIAGLHGRLCDRREPPAHGARIPDILEDHVIRLAALDQGALERLNLTIAAETGASLERAMLIQVPDRRGLLPGDAGCDPAFVFCQSLDRIGKAA